jgi:hypothetical protein
VSPAEDYVPDEQFKQAEALNVELLGNSRHWNKRNKIRMMAMNPHRTLQKNKTAHH